MVLQLREKIRMERIDNEKRSLMIFELIISYPNLTQFSKNLQVTP